MKNLLTLNLTKFKVVDGDYRVKATYSDDFILYRGDDFIEIIIDEKFLNRQKVKILLDNDVIFEGVLSDTSLFIPVEKSRLYDLDLLAKNLIIITDNNY
jgi:hypothetical protein